MASKTIARLAKFPGIWRVDGIAPISGKNRLGLRTTVYFSKIHEHMIGDPFKKASIENALDSEKKESLALSIHVAQTRMLKIGTLWQDGKRIRGANGSTNGTYEIDASAVRLVKLSEIVDVNGYQIPTILPQTHFFLPEESRELLAETYFALIPVKNNSSKKWIVVSAVELLRFYYGVSTRFISSSIWDSLASYVHWDKSSMDDDVAKIHSKSRLSKKELLVVARCLASDVANSSLRHIHNSLSAIKNNNAALPEEKKQPLSIKAGFPFDDLASISVSGKPIPLVAKPKGEWALFALEILHCTHSLGFSSIEEVSDEPEKGARQIAVGGGGMPVYDPSVDDDEPDVEDVPADGRLKRAATLSYGNQFQGVSEIKISRSLSEEGKMKVKKGLGPHSNVAVGAQTYNDNSSSPDGAGNLGINNYQSHMLPDRKLSQFLQMLTELQKLTAVLGWKIKTLANEHCSINELGHLITSFQPSMGSSRRSWHLIEAEGTKPRPRQLVWAEISGASKDKYFYILEMELKQDDNGQCTLIVCRNDLTAFTDEDLYELLFLTAVNNRWPKNGVENWKKEKHKGRAEKFLPTVMLWRIIHPDRPTIGKKEINEKAKLAGYATQWAEQILEELKEIGPIHSI